jgi:hypothetical protein
MKRTFIAVMGLTALCGCGQPRSTFDFVLGGDSDANVHSGARVIGHVNNAGFLTLDDPDTGWALGMSLGGLAPGSHMVMAKSGEFTITQKIGQPAIFTTALGGTCTVQLSPHNDSNGDVVHGTFFCVGVTSAAGKHVDVLAGEFRTAIDDESNNLNVDPPHP